MFTFATTDWRIANAPEWNQVPSPRLAKTCPSRENGACPTQGTPSPPIAERPSVVRSASSVMA